VADDVRVTQPGQDGHFLERPVHRAVPY
jgi:hypothetical protein